MPSGFMIHVVGEEHENEGKGISSLSCFFKRDVQK
jgi:hypothetical protein